MARGRVLAVLAICAFVLAACEIRTDYDMQIAEDTSAVLEFEITYDSEAAQLFGPAQDFLEEEIRSDFEEEEIEGVTLRSAEADGSDPEVQRVTAVFDAEDGEAFDRLVEDLFPGSSFTSQDGTTWTLLLRPDEDVAEDFDDELDLEAFGLDFISGEVRVDHAGSQISMSGGESDGGNAVVWDPFGSDPLEIEMDLSGAAPPAEEPAEEPEDDPVDEPEEEPVEEPAEEPADETEEAVEDDDALAVADEDEGLSTALLAAIIGGALLLLLLLILFLVLRGRRKRKASVAAAAAPVGAQQAGWAQDPAAQQPTQQMPPAQPPADQAPTQQMPPTQPGGPPPGAPGPQGPPPGSPQGPPPSGPAPAPSPPGPPPGSPPPAQPPQSPPPQAPPPSGPPGQGPPPPSSAPDADGRDR